MKTAQISWFHHMGLVIALTGPLACQGSIDDTARSNGKGVSPASVERPAPTEAKADPPGLATEAVPADKEFISPVPLSAGPGGPPPPETQTLRSQAVRIDLNVDLMNRFIQQQYESGAFANLRQIGPYSVGSKQFTLKLGVPQFGLDSSVAELKVIVAATVFDSASGQTTHWLIAVHPQVAIPAYAGTTLIGLREVFMHLPGFADVVNSWTQVPADVRAEIISRYRAFWDSAGAQRFRLLPGEILSQINSSSFFAQNSLTLVDVGLGLEADGSNRLTFVITTRVESQAQLVFVGDVPNVTNYQGDGCADNRLFVKTNFANWKVDHVDWFGIGGDLISTTRPNVTTRKSIWNGTIWTTNDFVRFCLTGEAAVQNYFYVLYLVREERDPDGTINQKTWMRRSFRSGGVNPNWYWPTPGGNANP